ncbi:hypothetical protein BC834DRAFT_842626 [Gloeopeniophorella convolvens]|nr:hypothetical protein BC834DRAFT_842626 [Gloeopeniophorella convolvens]
MPALGVPAEKLKPDPKYVQLIFGAAYDIRICGELFDGWAAQLDKLQSKKVDERERTLRHHLTLLREDVNWCARATDTIILCHARFAYLMAQRIDDANKSWLKSLKYGAETTRLANDINRAARALSQHVAQMQATLAAFVGALEQLDVRRKKSTARRVLGWLKHLFAALAGIFALGSFFSPFLHSVTPGISMVGPAVSTLWKAAASFCGTASEIPEGKETESIDSVLLFLKETVPREAQTAQKSLTRFDEALFIMGLEARMKTGRRVSLRGPDLGAIAQEWRGIAQQYQSLLPDDDEDDES